MFLSTAAILALAVARSLRASSNFALASGEVTTVRLKWLPTEVATPVHWSLLVAGTNQNAPIANSVNPVMMPYL